MCKRVHALYFTLCTLQTSHDPVYRKAWSKMKEFAKSGHDVLHTSNSYHVEKASKEDYVYIVDGMASVYAMKEDSRLTTLPEVILFMFYSVAMQKHSIYSQDVSVV